MHDSTESDLPTANSPESLTSQKLDDSTDCPACSSHSMFLRVVALSVLLFGGTAYGALLLVPELALKLPFIPDPKAVSNFSGSGSCGTCSMSSSAATGCPMEAMMTAASGGAACSECDASSSVASTCHCQADSAERTDLVSVTSDPCVCSKSTTTAEGSTESHACQSCPTTGEASCQCEAGAIATTGATDEASESTSDVATASATAVADQSGSTPAGLQ